MTLILTPGQDHESTVLKPLMERGAVKRRGRGRPRLRPRRVVGDKMGVKASGGVRSTEDAVRMAAAGANRLGASASIAIVSGADKGGGSGY